MNTDLLVTDPSLPEVTMTAEPVVKEITTRGGEVSFDGGSVNFPRGATVKDQQVEVITSFHMPHQMPPGVESVSPAILIRTTADLRKEADLKIYHNAHLETEEDTKVMMVLTSSTVPEEHGYEFKEEKKAKPNFSPKRRFGTIKMNVKSLWVKIARKKKKGKTRGKLF